MFGLRHSACCDSKLVIRREGPAWVEQHCPEPTFCSAWRPELSPHPQLIPWRRAQRPGCACVTKPHEKPIVHKRLHRGGADGNLSLSFPPRSLSLSLSLFTPARAYPHGRTVAVSHGSHQGCLDPVGQKVQWFYSHEAQEPQDSCPPQQRGPQAVWQESSLVKAGKTGHPARLLRPPLLPASVTTSLCHWPVLTLSAYLSLHWLSCMCPRLCNAPCLFCYWMFYDCSALSSGVENPQSETFSLLSWSLFLWLQ